MVFKDDVCMWFKNNQSHRRIELICGLLNMCLPMELRFIRTCVEDLEKRDDVLSDLDLKANNSQEISQLGKCLDERTRCKYIVYIALLEANNQACSKLLFQKLVHSQEFKSIAINQESNLDNVNEMLLIYTMVLHHPAFTFEEKRLIGDRLQLLKQQQQDDDYEKVWNLKSKSQYGLQECSQEDLTLDNCHSTTSPSNVYEPCDSGLSVGTDPEVELLSDHVCTSAGIHYEQESAIPTNNRISLDDFKELPIEITEDVLDSGNCGSGGHINHPNGVVTSLDPINEYDLNCPCSHTHDVSSGGSGESLDLYEESVAVPTTYIYNSNIYEQQDISHLPRDLVNLTLSYVCHCPYSVREDRTHSASLGRSTSGSEDGGIPSKPLPAASPSSSLQSSPFASPPQSLSPSRASSPPEGNLIPFHQPVDVLNSSSNDLVIDTSATIVISRSSLRPPSNSGKGSNLPSSPPCASSSSISSPKSDNWRADNRVSLPNASMERVIVHSSPSKMTTIVSCSSFSSKGSDSITSSVPSSLANGLIVTSTIAGKDIFSPKSGALILKRGTNDDQDPEGKKQHLEENELPEQKPSPKIKHSLPNGFKETLLTSSHKDPVSVPHSFFISSPISSCSHVSTTVVIPKIDHLHSKELPESNDSSTKSEQQNSPLGCDTTPGSLGGPSETPIKVAFITPLPSINTSTTSKECDKSTTPSITTIPPSSAVSQVNSSVSAPRSAAGSSAHSRMPTTVSMVTSNGVYPPYLPLPVLPAGSFPYQQGCYPTQGKGFVMSTPAASIIHIPSSHYQGQQVPRPRSSSGVGRKKPPHRGNSFQSKSISSDSSPSSSQYSSPAQTPSPDRMTDSHSKIGKVNEANVQEDTWEEEPEKYDPNRDCPPSSGTNAFVPSNPIRQRYIPYHHPFSFFGYPPHHGVFRYSLPPPSVMGPRPPLNSEKSSREATPPRPPMANTDVVQNTADYSGVIPSSISYMSPTSGSSASPPAGPVHIPEASAVPLLPPPPRSMPQNGVVQYSTNYPIFAGQFVTPMPGYAPSHGASLPNGFVSPNYPVPPIGSGINADLIYPIQYPVVGHSSSISCGGHPLMQPSGTISPSYHYHHSIHSGKKPPTCFTCGKIGHRVSDCKETSIDEFVKQAKPL